MKKTYIVNENNGERFALYNGIDRVYGGWIMETSGNPTTLNEMEDAISDARTDEDEAAAEKELDEIKAILADPATPWEDANEEDESYVNEWLKIWHC